MRGVMLTACSGFSNYFQRASYQESAVDAYLTQHDPGYSYYTFNGVDATHSGTNIGANGGRYNRAGRAFPDVSAVGAHFDIYLNGMRSETGGTSMSTPIWASILTLINEKRSQAGKGPVGFVNPVLYEHPEVFNDIVDGINPGCGTQGFSAGPGWDPVRIVLSDSYLLPCYCRRRC
jgi:tripeptidyl-peptidase-1